MRRLVPCYLIALLFFPFLIHHPKVDAAASSTKLDKLSLILEVEGNPQSHRLHIEQHYPGIEVVAVYEKLFKGLALRGRPDQMNRLRALDFVQAVHPVQTYRASSERRLLGANRLRQKRTLQEKLTSLKKNSDFVLPHQLNDTSYTGKGIKVAVVDTGIDYTHPDLQKNYKGGYDAVDLDDDPMETKPEEGIPTLHGSHVAGIIAANGNLKGVAPDAEIKAYRALGPGGSGTSIQVIAAMEEAAKDGVDIMNLSLGNTVNGPDYPTSIAVNRAEELGILVVVANGNDGPNNWTVGSPATAVHALGVGAASHPQTVPYLEETFHHRKFPIALLSGSTPWNIERGAYLADGEDPKADLTGKIALVQRGKQIPFALKALAVQARGAKAVLIYNNEKGVFQGSVGEAREIPQIPVAALTKAKGEWLRKQLDVKKNLYLNVGMEKKETGIASFSSRGPVSANWTIKPDILAPGTSIVSTVPDGYEALQGTSMAAPHVAGAAALVKEAHPTWSNQKIISALKTTAKRLEQNGTPLDPIEQGMGQIQPNAAIYTANIIDNPLLSFGKTERAIEKKQTQITIENISNRTQVYTFRIPKKQAGLIWHLPKRFSIKPHDKKTITVGLDIYSEQKTTGIQQGWLSLERDNGILVHLPYMFINKAADDPKAAGLEFSLKPFSEDTYSYQLHLGADVKHAEVSLYNPDTLVYERSLLELDKPQTGMNKGEINKKAVPLPGFYMALITVQLEDGSYQNYEAWIEVL